MTTDERFQQVEELFDRVLEQPEAERAEWLRAECDDEEIRREVEQMLAAHGRADGILEQAVVQAVVLDVREQLERELGDRYDIEYELGHGGSAIVYVAHEKKHGRSVVLKVLKPEVARMLGSDRFLREVHIAAQLAHPNILGLIDSGDAGGLLYYVMPRVEGESMRDRLLREGPLDVGDAVTLLRDVADALAYAHRKGVVHRDLKPDNVLCARDHAFLMDFGIAKLIGSSHDEPMTGVGIQIGTPGYMAPEQRMGDPELDHRADLYAWGLLAYETLTGQVPSDKKPAGRAKRVPVSAYRDDVPEVIAELIEACLERSPEHRIHDAADIVMEIDQLGTFATGSKPATAGRSIPLWGWLLAAALVVAGVVGVRALTTTGTDAALNLPVAVAALSNETGDSTLGAWGRLAGDWLTQGLQETGLVSVVPWPSARQASDRLAIRQADGDAVDAAQFMRSETGAGTVVTGSYYLVNDDVHFKVELTDAASGELLVAPRPVVVGRASLETGVRDLRDRVMSAIAIRTDDRLAEMPGLTERPPTYEAYRLFDNAMTLYLDQEYRLAVEELQRAHALDTTFLVPLVYAMTGLVNRDEFVQADSLVAHLRERRERLSEYHRHLVDYIQAGLEGDGERALRMIRQAAALAPGSRGEYNYALAALRLNRPREALGVLDQLDPDGGALRGWSSYWTQLTHALHLLGEHDREVDAARALRERYPARRVGLVLEVRALAAAGRTSEVDAAIAADIGLPPNTYWSQGAAMVQAGEELQVHGYPDSARRFFDAAIEWFESQLRVDPTNNRFRYWVGSAYYDVERWVDAARMFTGLAEEYPTSGTYRGLAAVAAARASVFGSPEEWLGEPPRYERGEYLMYRGRIAAARGEVDAALSLISEAFGRGVDGFPWLHASAFHDFRPLAADPRYVRLMSADQ